VRLVNGKWQCAYCQAELDVPEGQQPISMLISASGRPRERALLLNGQEIHRCEVPRAT
jgi:hypothetical protein